MRLINYLGKVVKINLKMGFYYKGTVESADQDSIGLIDVKGNWVDISEESIATIEEVNNG